MASAKGVFTGSQLRGTLKHLSALGLAGRIEMRGEPDGPQLHAISTLSLGSCASNYGSEVGASSA